MEIIFCIDEVSFGVVRNCDSSVELGGQQLFGFMTHVRMKINLKSLGHHFDDPHQSRFSVRNAQKCLFTATLMKR